MPPRSTHVSYRVRRVQASSQDRKKMRPERNFSSVHSVSRFWLFDPMDCSTATPRVYSNSCPLSRWCHPAISSSVIPFSSCLQSFPASGSFQMSQLFTSGGQSIGISASASVLPRNSQDWIPLGWTGWISLQSKGFSRVLQHHSSEASVLWRSAFFMGQLSHLCMTTGKTLPLTRRTFVRKVIPLFFNILSRFVIAFLPRSKSLF